MKKQRLLLLTGVLIAFVIFGLNQTIAYGDETEAPETGGIVNTRHNLSIDWLGADSTIMDVYRNDYDRVCVYCHTPHGANTSDPMKDAPLWNRTHIGNTYITFTDQDTGRIMKSTLDATQPGVSSLTCLSCHDGTLAIDSIINMPGSGGYNVAAEESQVENGHLDTWVNPSGISTFGHATLEDCRSICHNPDSFVGDDAPDFGAFVLGLDLTNDHPIGINMPDPVLYGFNWPDTVDGNKWFYDLNESERADRNEIRLYDTGDGYEIECASCHDPHGVQLSGGGGGGDAPLTDTFLRIENAGSNVCLTCHIK